AQLLHHPLSLHSVPGRGSVFSITVGRAAASAAMPLLPAAALPILQPIRVLVVDNDEAVLRGM
ncbi:MAG: hybrid sensor histidine kinase/response regulator, partial [Lysobacterales bacterium CG_4_9_14_3_um_filter_62_6]